MKFERHYTGIEVWQRYFGHLELYVQRDAHAHKVQFLRTSFSLRSHGIPFSTMLGLFVGRTNYIHASTWSGPGFEVFTERLHFGYVNASKWSVDWSGSTRDPRASFTWRMGRIGIGARTPAWVKRLLRARDVRRDRIEMQRYSAEYEDYCAAHGIDPDECDYAPDDAPNPERF